MSLRAYPALAISLMLHASILGVLGIWKLASQDQTPDVILESVFSEERVQEQFVQDVEIDTTTSELLSLTSGGVVNDNLGSSANTPISQTRIEQSQVTQDPQVRVENIGDIDVPGLARLGDDLGEGEVSGEIGARVEGYGAAMHRLTQEIIRMMRDSPVVAVWMFDASNSLSDDREEIRDNFNKIYEELDIAREQADQANERYASLETMICSFGDDLKPLLPRPTSELAEITAAIDRVEDDESGNENVFGAVSTVIDEYGVSTGRSRRKLAIIIVTDESGDDGQLLEEVIQKADRYNSPVYILGREAIFGYKYAHVRWIDEETGLGHWIRINRGPETAFPEGLQYDGFGGRHDATSSGFGPYAQVRLVRESGGIFFMLSRAEENLLGSAARSPRKFDDIAMREYIPLLMERREYARERDASDFRRTVWEVIQALDPEEDRELSIRRLYYPLEPEEFRAEGERQFERALRSMRIINEAIARLERVRPDRELEASQRWRAAYDLMYAQCLSYRVRQFQFMLAIDEHDRNPPTPSDPKSNRWNAAHISELVEPTEEQIAATKVDMEEIESQLQLAMDMYQSVIDQHPGTPWAQRAQQEMGWGFGITFRDHFWDPRYQDPGVRDRIPNF